MDDGDKASDQRREQAAQWFARLKTVPVSRGTLDAFFEWQRDTANAAAFAEAEQLGGRVGKLGSSPAMLRLANDAMTRGTRPRSPSSRRTLALCASFALGLLLAGWWLIARVPAQPYATAVGELRSLALSDGSRVELNTDTRVVAQLGRAERRIRLDKGEALFAVAHDNTRPFLVTAGDVIVRATGTRFEVQHLEGRTLVVLFAGGVDITAPGIAKVNLRPGQTWQSKSKSASAPGARTVDPSRALAWTQRRVVFDATPLAEAIVEVNRYSDRKIVLSAEDRGAELISGSFTTGDPQAFARAVAAMLSLEARSQPHGPITLSAR